ncbi:MAG: hypothetical protein ABL971_01225 [Vicinamibacterales bacterium]
MAAVIVAAYRFLTFVDFSNDHYVHLSRSQQLMLGDLPVRDFVDPGQPMAYLTSWAIQRMLGPGLLSELLLVSACFGVAAALCWVVTIRLTSSWLLAAAATLMQAIVFPATYSYPKMLMAGVMGATLLAFAGSPRVLSAMVVGAGTGFAFLFRHDLGLFAAAGCGAAAILLSVRRTWSGVTGRQILLGVVTAAMVALPWLVWVQAQVGVARYFADGVEFSSIERARSFLAWPIIRTGPGPLVMWPADAPLPRPTIHVRWRPGEAASTAQALAESLGLVNGEERDRGTWIYEIQDWSPAALRRIVTSPAIEDTHGIDRLSFNLTDPPSSSLAARGMSLVRRALSVEVPGLQLGANSATVMYYLAWCIAGLAALLWGLARPVDPPVAACVAALIVWQTLVNLTFLRDALIVRAPDVFGSLPPPRGLGGGPAVDVGWRLATRRCPRCGHVHSDPAAGCGARRW